MKTWRMVTWLYIYSSGLFYGTVRFVEYIASSGWLMSECCIEQYVKVSGRGLILDGMLEFAWLDWGKPRKLISDRRFDGLHHNRTASKYKFQSLPLEPAPWWPLLALEPAACRPLLPLASSVQWPLLPLEPAARWSLLPTMSHRT